MINNPVKYWRKNKEWSKFIGQSGRVVASSFLSSTTNELRDYLPYSFVLVEVMSGKLKGERFELMGVGHTVFTANDKVNFVFRRLFVANSSSLINYGIKVKLK